MNAFMMFLIVDKGSRKSTANLKRRIVAKFLSDTGTTDPTHDQFRRYIMLLHETKKTRSHIANCIISMEFYFEFIGNPISVKRPRKTQQIVDNTLSEADIALIFASCANEREKAVLAVIAYSGIRCEEVCNLKLNDVNLGGRSLKVTGKGGHEGISFISSDCVNLVLAYLEKYPRDKDSYLFTTSRAGKQMSPTSIRRLVKKIAGRSPVGKRVHPHLFRHSLATNMLDRGANPVTIQKQLRHRHLSTTMIYVHSRPQKVEAEYMNFGPKYT